MSDKIEHAARAVSGISSVLREVTRERDELRAEVERLRADIKDHEAREQLMFEVARRLFGEDEAKRWLTVVFEAYRELANHKE